MSKVSVMNDLKLSDVVAHMTSPAYKIISVPVSDGTSEAVMDESSAFRCSSNCSVPANSYNAAAGPDSHRMNETSKLFWSKAKI